MWGPSDGLPMWDISRVTKKHLKQKGEWGKGTNVSYDALFAPNTHIIFMTKS